MRFDPGNPVNQRCVEGLDHEGRGDMQAAALAYRQAWTLAQTDLEKLTAALYLARTQPTPADKLHWDQTALALALGIPGPAASLLPSLYLNTGKCHEEPGDYKTADAHYRLAQDHAPQLPSDGYENMIRSGIAAALERMRRRLIAVD